jgi:hypothetical protein
VYTLLLSSSNCRGFQEELFIIVSKGGFVGGICTRVSMSVACKVLAGLYYKVLERILWYMLGNFAYREGYSLDLGG